MFDYNGEFSNELLDVAEKAEAGLQDIFKEIDDICEANQYKVLSAFK